jgi:hypothetical protein
MSDVNNRGAEERPKSVVGPDGKMLTLDDLPPPNTQRWVARRKGEVVTAVRAGCCRWKRRAGATASPPRSFSAGRRQSTSMAWAACA